MEPEVLYRIYTQDKPEYRQEIVRALSAHGLPHFTFVPAGGYGPDQDGKPEHTVVVEIATSPESEPAVIRTVKMLKLRNGEGSVKLVRVGVAGALVTDPTFRVSVTQDGRVGVLVRDPDGDVPRMTKEELSAAIHAQIRRGRTKIDERTTDMKPEQWAEILSRPRVLHARFTNIYKLSHQGEATATQKARGSRLKLTVLIWC